MKDIDSFFKEINRLYQRALPGLETNNFVHFDKTAIFPSNHYRFEIAIERDDYSLLNQRKYHLDYKLLAIFIEYRLCDSKPYKNIFDITRYYALPEQALASCSEENSNKIIKELSAYIDNMFNAWSLEIKKEFKEQVSKLSFYEQLDILLSYDCYPYEIVLIAKDKTVHDQVKMFFDKKRYPYRYYLYIGTYRSHTYRTSIPAEDHKLVLALLTELDNLFQPFRLRHKFDTSARVKIEDADPNDQEIVKRNNPKKTRAASRYALKFVSFERKRPAEPIYPEVAKQLKS
jgi:hypothetical protein